MVKVLSLAVLCAAVAAGGCVSRSDYDDLNAELAKCHQELSAKDADLAKAQTDREALQKQGAQQAQVDNLKRSNQQLEVQVQTSSRQVQEATSKLAELQQQVQNFAQGLVQREEAIKSLNEQNQKLQDRIRELEAAAQRPPPAPPTPPAASSMPQTSP
jgi:chromosome segregation ATPase